MHASIYLSNEINKTHLSIFICIYSHESRMALLRDFLLGVFSWVPDDKAGNLSEDLAKGEDRATV